MVGFLTTPYHQCAKWRAGICSDRNCKKWHADNGCIVTRLPRSRNNVTLGVAILAHTQTHWVASALRPTETYEHLLAGARAKAERLNAARQLQVQSVGSNYRPSGEPTALAVSSALRPAA